MAQRRVAAEAGRGFRRLAALPLRSAPDREGRAAAAPRLRPAEGARRRLHAQRVAVPAWSSAPIPRATRHFVSESQAAAAAPVRRVPAAGRHHGAGDSTTDEEPRRRRRRQGGVMDLSTTYLGMRLPHPLVVGRRAARRRSRRRQRARRRRRRGDRAALAVRRGDHRRADGRSSSTSTATANRSPRPPASFRARRRSRSGPTSTSSTCAG